MDATLFIVASSVLSVFNVTKAKDENGQEIPVKVAMTVQSGIVVYVSFYRSSAHLRAYCFIFSRHPEEFQCSIFPRDKVAEELVLASSLH